MIRISNSEKKMEDEGNTEWRTQMQHKNMDELGLYSVSAYNILWSKSSLRPSQIQHLNQGRPLAVSDGASVGQEKTH